MPGRYGASDGRQDPNPAIESIYANPTRVVGPIRSILAIGANPVYVSLSVGSTTGCANAIFQVTGGAHITSVLGIGTCPPASPTGLYLGVGAIALFGTDPGGADIVRIGGSSTLSGTLTTQAGASFTRSSTGSAVAVFNRVPPASGLILQAQLNSVNALTLDGNLQLAGYDSAGVQRWTLGPSVAATGFEFGRQDGTAATAFIDFHTGATPVDFDSRLEGTGGTGSVGGGDLTMQGAAFRPRSGTPTLGTSGQRWGKFWGNDADLSADLTLGARLVLSTAASKVVPGATSLSLRNNADSADNVLVLNSGNTTVLGSLAWGAGAAIASSNSLVSTTNVNTFTREQIFQPSAEEITCLFTGPTATVNTTNLLKGTQTWNGSGVAFTGLLFNFTDTLSSASTKFISFQIATVERFSIAKDGALSLTPSGATAFKVAALSSSIFANAALGTTATDGFVYLPTSAGAPTGVPTTQTGTVAVEYDTTNDKLQVYNGSWKGFKPVIANAVQVLYTSGQVSTSATVDTSLASYTLPGGTLGVNGQKLRITLLYNTGVAACTFNIVFGGTTICSIVPAASVSGSIIININRDTGTTQHSHALCMSNSLVVGSDTDVSSFPAETLSGNVTIDFRGRNNSAGTLLFDSICVEYISA